MSNNILDYPDTEAVFPDNRAHALLLWLSLESLDPFWKAGFPALSERLDALRSAARFGLKKRHDDRNASVRQNAQAAMDAETSELFRAFLVRDDFLQEVSGLDAWASFFSAFRSEPETFGLSDPEHAHDLAKNYKADVSKMVRSIMAELRASILQAPLSDWDMEQHARYGENYHEDGKGDRSAILSNLSALLAAHLFDDFMKTNVLTLPAAEQERLHTAVQAEWSEGLDDPVLSGVPIQRDVPHAIQVTSP